ncbi:MAG: S6e family ribosomal protein [archaeon]|nr:S6e family ribosomal protein [archaeon]
MKFVISDSKNGKSYSKTVEDAKSLYGKKVGDMVELSGFGLSGLEAKITGGSDRQGFPMKADLVGTMRKKIFITTNRKKGTKMRVSRRGNTISVETAQLNLIVTKTGSANLAELLPQEKKEEKSGGSIKEEMIKQSLEVAGTTKAAEAMSKEEFKKGDKKRG